MGKENLHTHTHRNFIKVGPYHHKLWRFYCTWIKKWINKYESDGEGASDSLCSLWCVCWGGKTVLHNEGHVTVLPTNSPLTHWQEDAHLMTGCKVLNWNHLPVSVFSSSRLAVLHDKCQDASHTELDTLFWTCNLHHCLVGIFTCFYCPSTASFVIKEKKYIYSREWMGRTNTAWMTCASWQGDWWLLCTTLLVSHIKCYL